MGTDKTEPGADYPERTTSLDSCNGGFIDLFIFRLKFLQIQSMEIVFPCVSKNRPVCGNAVYGMGAVRSG